MNHLKSRKQTIVRHVPPILLDTNKFNSPRINPYSMCDQHLLWSILDVLSCITKQRKKEHVCYEKGRKNRNKRTVSLSLVQQRVASTIFLCIISEMDVTATTLCEFHYAFLFLFTWKRYYKHFSLNPLPQDWRSANVWANVHTLLLVLKCIACTIQ